MKDDCKYCYGTGYVAGWIGTSNSAYNIPPEAATPNTVVPCQCLTPLERMAQRFRGFRPFVDDFATARPVSRSGGE